MSSTADTLPAQASALGEEPVEQSGRNFSGGQRQRLTIARALVRKPEIYIFDDSFSALDAKTDAALRAALKRTTQDATVLIVAQKVSTILDADRIIVLDGGGCVGPWRPVSLPRRKSRCRRSHPSSGKSPAVSRWWQVGMGTHRELLQSCPVYQEIVYSQMPAEEVGA